MNIPLRLAAALFVLASPAWEIGAEADQAPDGANAAGEKDDLLMVTGWHSYGGPHAANEQFLTLGATVAEGKLWVFGRYSDNVARLLGFDLETFKVESTKIEPPGAPAEHRNFPFQAFVAPDAFYIVNEGPKPEADQPHTAVLSRYDRKERTWESRSIPWVQPGGVSFVDGVFYLNIAALVDKVPISGIARYDWGAGKLSYLADNRRKPALNQFDNRKDYSVAGVFEGPGRKLCAVVGGTPYFARDGAGKWVALDVHPGVTIPDFSTSVLDGKTLLFSPVGDWVYFCDPAANTLEAWITPDGKGLWDPAPEFEKYRHIYPGAYIGLVPGGFIWMDQAPGSLDRFELRWFKRGGPRAGERLSLLLKSDNAPDPKPFGPISGRPSGENVSAAMNTEKGIVIWNGGDGFWFVPYADIEAHLKKAK